MKVRFRSKALSDLTEIRDYIARDNPSAARRVVERLRSAIERLSLFPQSGRKGSARGTFELVVPKLPYIVVYRIARPPDEQFIDIVSIVHGARKHRR